MIRTGCVKDTRVQGWWYSPLCFVFNTHTHTQWISSHFTVQDCWLTPRQPPHYIFTHFPQWERLSLAADQGPEQKTRRNGSIKLQQVKALPAARTRADKRNEPRASNCGRRWNFCVIWIRKCAVRTFGSQYPEYDQKNNKKKRTEGVEHSWAQLQAMRCLEGFSRAKMTALVFY